MFDTTETWLERAHEAARRYAALRRRIEELETEAAVALADMVEAYAWPEGLPVPEGREWYGPETIGGRVYGEDLTCELAVAERMSQGAAWQLAADVVGLTSRLPRCWARVASGAAPLWQARRVVRACEGLGEAAYPVVDAAVAPCLGAVGLPRLTRLLAAAVVAADPEGARRRAAQGSRRYVRTGGDESDPLSGYVCARLDRSDTIFFDATVQRIADVLAAQGDAGSADERRAKAFGVLANPAAAVQLIGVPTTRGMDPAPATEAERQAFVAAAGALVAPLTPRAQVYAHYWADSAPVAEALARVESVGGLLVEQVAALTGSCSIRVTPVVHVGGAGIAVDGYEIPQRIRDRVLLRDGHDVFPWSSVESRRLDLDHTVPWEPDGPPGQTAPGNLGPLSRRAHRVKTHAGWRLDQPSPGEFVWQTGAGQVIRVDAFGSRRLPARPPTDSGRAEAALAPGVGLDGGPQVAPVDGRPGFVEERQLGVGRLPQEEIGQALLAGGA